MFFYTLQTSVICTTALFCTSRAIAPGLGGTKSRSLAQNARGGNSSRPLRRDLGMSALLLTASKQTHERALLTHSKCCTVHCGSVRHSGNSMFHSVLFTPLSWNIPYITSLCRHSRACLLFSLHDKITCTKTLCIHCSLILQRQHNGVVFLLLWVTTRISVKASKACPCYCQAKEVYSVDSAWLLSLQYYEHSHCEWRCSWMEIQKGSGKCFVHVQWMSQA